MLAVAVIIAGVLLIIFAKAGVRQPQERQAAVVGLLGALGAGVLWGIYYIPIKMSGASMWIAAVPMAVGIFVGSGLLLLLSQQSPRLDALGEYARHRP